MDARKVFTLDPDYFPLKRMREIIDRLHDNNQQYGKHPYFDPELMPLISHVN